MAIELGYGVGLDKDNKAVVTTSIDVYDNEGNKMGYCTGLTRNDTRNLTRVRHLDSSDAGRVVEMMPQPTDVNLSLTGLALYNDGNNRKGLLNRIPGSAAAQFVSLDQQRETFTIKLVETHPTTKAVTTTYFHGCMLQTYNHPIALGTVNIAETANVWVSWVDSK